MFREMRRQERKIDYEECESILKSGLYGMLSTIDDEGYPYGVPLNYVYINEKVYFHCALEGKKLDNIKRSSKVSFCVVDNPEIEPESFSTRYRSVIIFGTVEESVEQEKEEILVGFLDKYAPELMDKGKDFICKLSGKTRVFGINIDHISGKARR